MTKNRFAGLVGLLLLGKLLAANAAADRVSSDAILILDLPPAAASAETRAAVTRQIAAALPSDSHLGVVAADKPDGDLLSALSEPAVAVKAIEAAAVQPAVTKDPAAAVERALYELRIGGRPNVTHAIIYVGDGKAEDRAANRRSWMLGSLMQDAVRNNTRIFFVAWGEDADMEVAQTLARSTGGEYFRTASADTLRGVTPSIKRLLLEPLAPSAKPAPAATPTATAPTTMSPPSPAPVALPAAPPASEESSESTESVHPAPEADRWAGIFLAGLVGLGVLGGAIAAFVISRRAKPEVGRGAVRATPNAYLVDLHGTTPLSRYVLGARPVIIGRIAGRDTRQFDYITVPINTVSRRHAVIEYHDGAYWVIDQGSVNGTRVNDKRIKGKCRLQHGDRIGLHRCELQFETEASSIDGDQTISADMQTFGAATQIAPAAPVAAASAATVIASSNSVPAASVEEDSAKTIISKPKEMTSPPVLTVPELPPAAAAAAVPEVPRKSLDSFINTTLIQQHETPPDDGLSGQTDITFAPIDSHSSELSIDDFMDVSEPFAPSEMPTSVAPVPPPKQQSTQKLAPAPADTEVDEFRLGDTINLFDPESFGDGETTPLEQFLREHATDDGLKNGDETKLIKSEWEKSRKQQ